MSCSRKYSGNSSGLAFKWRFLLSNYFKPQPNFLFWGASQRLPVWRLISFESFANCAALQPFTLVAASRFTMTDIHYFQLEVWFRPHACIRSNVHELSIAVEQLVKRAQPTWSQSNCQDTLCCVICHKICFKLCPKPYGLIVCICDTNRTFDLVDQTMLGLHLELLFLKINSINM